MTDASNMRVTIEEFIDDEQLNVGDFVDDAIPPQTMVSTGSCDDHGGLYDTIGTNNCSRAQASLDRRLGFRPSRILLPRHISWLHIFWLHISWLLYTIMMTNDMMPTTIHLALLKPHVCVEVSEKYLEGLQGKTVNLTLYASVLEIWKRIFVSTCGIQILLNICTRVDGVQQVCAVPIATLTEFECIVGNKAYKDFQSEWETYLKETLAPFCPEFFFAGSVGVKNQLKTIGCPRVEANSSSRMFEQSGEIYKCIRVGVEPILFCMSSNNFW